MDDNKKLQFVDLFAGIGGFHLGVTGVFDAECVFASDIDESCREVYYKNFSLLPAGDIRPLTEGARVEVPDHDLLCAGFPCQPFSKSGKQAGINETRGTLFYNILKVLDARRPRYILLENVRNLAGPRHRHTWATIVSNLRMLGYRVSDKPTILSPHQLPPSLGGRPQVRERVFIPAVYVGEGTHPDDLHWDPLAENRPLGGWDPQLWNIDDYLQPETELTRGGSWALRDSEIDWIETWNDLLSVLPPGRLPGFPLWADDFLEQPTIERGTPAWKEAFLRKNSEFYLQNREVIDRWKTDHRSLALLPPSRRKFEWQAQDAPRDLWQLVIHMRPSGIRVKRGTYLPALVAITQTSVIGWRKRRITPREGARLQGFPDAFILHPDEATAFRHLGNAVNVGVVQHLVSALASASASYRDRQLALPLAVA